jgi:predicted NBD/HSP70 family sugar kinase
MTDRGVVLGADIGGSHITAALFDLHHKQIITPSLSRKSIMPNAGVDDLIAGWGECLQKARGESDIEKICLAMPGPFDYDEGVCLIRDQNKYPGLYGVNIKQKLAAVLKVAPSGIFLHNDAACFLQGEVFCGSVADFESVVGVTLGTGLGTATYSNGRAESADLWNMPFLDSFAEDYISSRWFTSQYEQQTGRSIPGVKELASLAGSDETASTLFQVFGQNLGAFLNKFIERHNPGAVVIGGNIANAYALFEPEVLNVVYARYPAIAIHQSMHGENAALIGAISSWYTSNRPGN